MLTEDAPFGFAARLPWGKHPTSGKWTVFLDENFQKYENQEAIFDLITPLNEEEVDEIITELRGEEAEEAKEEKKEEITFPATSGFLPCFREFLVKIKNIEKGSRNDTFFRAGIHLKKRGWSKDEVILYLSKVNNNLEEPLPDREFKKTMKSIFEKGYSSLGCDDPIWSGIFCSEEFKKNCPVVKPQVRLVYWTKSIPARYYISYKDTKISEPLSVKQILNPEFIQLFILERFGEEPYLPPKRDWKNLIITQIQRANVEEPGEKFADSLFRLRQTICQILS